MRRFDMKYLLKFKMIPPVSNDAIKSPEFGQKMHELLADLKAEAAYFTAIDGYRGGFVVVNLNDASEIPKVAEPFFLWLNAEVEFLPVMLPQDLDKAGPEIGNAIRKWA
jgi:hypothetical protein